MRWEAENTAECTHFTQNGSTIANMLRTPYYYTAFLYPFYSFFYTQFYFGVMAFFLRKTTQIQNYMNVWLNLFAVALSLRAQANVFNVRQAATYMRHTSHCAKYTSAKLRRQHRYKRVI